MNILFITIGRMESIANHGIYTDLLRHFRDCGHRIFTVSPYEKRTGLDTALINENGVNMLHVSIGNITKCSILEKGISTLQIESKFLSAIKKYFGNERFDLVLYTTPPITFANVIRYVKKRDNAKTYLLLKDIFPQNAVDIGMMRTSGVKGVLYKYFRKKEAKLYAISDRIGCMSQANAEYVLRHNPEVSAQKVGICPNAIEIQDVTIPDEQKAEIRQKYGIPLDKKVFVYGGNLGRPQGIPFLMECLKTQVDNPDAFFLVVGDGTEYGKLEAFFQATDAPNMKLLKRLPKEDYDRMVAACDVGMIFLDHRFTIPNFPSRLLAYMQAQLPVLACTDPNTDIGTVIAEGNFGWWCESNSTAAFASCVQDALNADLKSAGMAGYQYLAQHYTAKQAYETIMADIAK